MTEQTHAVHSYHISVPKHKSLVAILHIYLGHLRHMIWLKINTHTSRNTWNRLTANVVPSLYKTLQYKLTQMFREGVEPVMQIYVQV